MESTGIRTLNCPNCGAPVGSGDLNCDYCGGAIYAGQAAEITVPAVAQAQKIIPEMQRRIQENPYDGEAYYRLGLACYTLQLYDEAEHAFVQARRFSPGSAVVFYFTGLAMLRQAEREILSIQEYRIVQIREQFETAAELDPNMNLARVYLELTNALRARTHEDYAGALKPLQAVTAALPKLGVAWKVLAACHFQVGDYGRAIEAGCQAFEIDPKDPDVAYLVGSAYSRLGETDRMESWARRVARLRNHPDRWREVVREFKGLFE